MLLGLFFVPPFLKMNWLNIPPELFSYTFRFLKLNDLPSVLLVCKAWHAAAVDNELWTFFNLSYFKIPPKYTLPFKRVQTLMAKHVAPATAPIIELKFIHSSAPDYSASYNKELLLKNTGTFCTATNYNCNVDLLLTPKDDRNVLFSSFDLIPPGTGFTAPVGYVLLWIFDKEPDLTMSNFYDIAKPKSRDDFNFEKYITEKKAELKQNPQCTSYPVPLLWIEIGKLKYALPHLHFGKYIHLKLLRSKSARSIQNIDIKFFGAHAFELEGKTND
eukprot:TRINITY_DN13960_c0_g1_i1.p1 TRINITY_DN13960_c0_g1~~TRINITY_DN13960_c0_g1_i1.p1  ORF type:complete len:274 (-),score=29.32 TRINITY_DN13960_c0_g1_i1:43-864(-)